MGRRRCPQRDHQNIWAAPGQNKIIDVHFFPSAAEVQETNASLAPAPGNVGREAPAPIAFDVGMGEANAVKGDVIHGILSGLEQNPGVSG